MTTNNQTPLPSVFSPLAKALLDAFSEAVIVFDPEGKVLYANQQARELGLDLSRPASDLTPALAELGGRLKPLRVGHLDLGEAMFLQGSVGPTTLAEDGRAETAFAWTTGQLIYRDQPLGEVA